MGGGEENEPITPLASVIEFTARSIRARQTGMSILGRQPKIKPFDHSIEAANLRILTCRPSSNQIERGR